MPQCRTARRLHLCYSIAALLCIAMLCAQVRLLPEEVERRELPRALGSLASLLLERTHRVRDDTRTVLVAMAQELGPRYMPYIINVLRYDSSHSRQCKESTSLFGACCEPVFKERALLLCTSLITATA